MGVDRKRSTLDGRSLGTWKANVAGTFREGAPVMRNSSGEVLIFDAASGSELLGVALHGKVTLGVSVVIDESVTFGTSGAVKNLDHAGLISGSTAVRSAVIGGGTTYTGGGTDYTISLTNGTITHVGTIDPTLPVYVSYSWTLTEADYLLQGKNFYQSADQVTQEGGFVAVIEAPAIIYTTEFDADQIYSLTGSTSNVYANSAGLFSSSSSSAKLCGKVVSVPTNEDPFLGIKFIGQTLANS